MLRNVLMLLIKYVFHILSKTSDLMDANNIFYATKSLKNTMLIFFNVLSNLCMFSIVNVKAHSIKMKHSFDQHLENYKNIIKIKRRKKFMFNYYD